MTGSVSPRTLLLTAVLAAGAAQSAPLKLVVPDLNAVGPSKDRAAFYTEHISSRLSEVGAEVTTSRALAQLIGIERQRQLLGCAGEGGSCVAELASALGTDALLLGDVAQIDTLFQVNLKLVSGADGKTVSTYQARVTSEAALLDELDKAAYALVSEAAPMLNRDAPRAPKTKGPSLRTLSIVPAGIGLVSAVVSAVLFTQAFSAYNSIPGVSGGPPATTAQVEAIAANGKLMQTLAWVFAGVGIAGLATGATLFALGGRKPSVQATVAPMPGGATFLIGGDL